MEDQVRALIRDWEHCLEMGNATECMKLGQLLIGIGAYFEDNVWKINLKSGNAL